MIKKQYFPIAIYKLLHQNILIKNICIKKFRFLGLLCYDIPINMFIFWLINNSI